MSYSEAVKKLYDAKRQRLATEMGGSPMMSNTFSSFNREAELGMNVAKTIDLRLQYLRDIYNQSLENIKSYNKQRMLGEVAQSFGELAGAVTPYVGDWIKSYKLKQLKTNVPAKPVEAMPNRDIYSLRLLTGNYQPYEFDNSGGQPKPKGK